MRAESRERVHMNKRMISLLAIALMVVAGSLAGAEPIAPGPDAQELVQEALILAEPGDTIEFAEGVFEFTRGLSLDVDNVTLRGQGMDRTVFSFKNQDAGSEGLIVTSDGVTLAQFAVEDTIGDAIKAKGCENISFIGVRTEWTGGPKETNGAYGLYPVDCENVLIDGCLAVAASDAGLYIGQSRNIIVRNSIAKYNVAGIEIENCYNADVYNNIAIHNTGGILVFDLPNLPQQGGHNVRVFANHSVDNDTPNFAPKGNIVANVPMGTGLLVMANRNVEVFENTFSGNATANVIVSSYRRGPEEKVDPNYYPYPEAIHIHHNRFGTGGNAPSGPLGMLAASALGTPMPDIVWDGAMNEEKVVDGKLPKQDWIYIHSNGAATFGNANLPDFMKDPENARPKFNPEAHEGKLPPLKPVKLNGRS